MLAAGCWLCLLLFCCFSLAFWLVGFAALQLLLVLSLAALIVRVVSRALKKTQPQIIPPTAQCIFSFVHSFIQLLTHSAIHSFTHSVIQSFTHSLLDSFIHSFIYSFIHHFIHSAIQQFSNSAIQQFSNSASQRSNAKARTCYGRVNESISQ